MQRLRVLLVSILVLSFTWSAPLLAQSPLDDYVSDDWAYYALVELGRGRPIEDFMISAQMTRYQGALMLSRLLDHIDNEQPVTSRRFGVSRDVVLDQMIIDYNERVQRDYKLTSDQIELLYRLVLEFRPELEILGYSVQDYAILLGLNAAGQLGGLFTERQLTYTAEALAAVRNSNPQTNIPVRDMYDIQENISQQDLLAFEETLLQEPVLEPDQPNPASIWVGEAPRSYGLLPTSARIFAEDDLEQTEQGAIVSFGDVELSGILRALEQGYQPIDELPPSEGGAGYGLAVQYGDLYLSTIRDYLAVEDGQGSSEQLTSTSLDLSVGLKNSVLVSAGYRHLDTYDATDEGGKPHTATVGVELPITGGRLHLGMSSGWESSEDADTIEAPEERNPIPTRSNTAELGLSYDFENDSSLRLNYRLIDFSTVNPSYGATAEFSIKF